MGKAGEVLDIIDEGKTKGAALKHTLRMSGFHHLKTDKKDDGDEHLYDHASGHTVKVKDSKNGPASWSHSDHKGRHVKSGTRADHLNGHLAKFA